MKANKLTLKLFLATSLPFGTVVAIHCVVMDRTFSFGGFISAVILGLIEGIFFGGSMSLILGFCHARSVKTLATSTEQSETARVEQAQHILLGLPYEDTFDACLVALSQKLKSRIVSQDRSKGRIVAKKATWKTWEDTITIDFSALSLNQTEIHIHSKPTSPFILLDYGSNALNVATIIRYLASSSEQTGHLYLRPAEMPKRSEQELLHTITSENNIDAAQLLRSNNQAKD